MNDLIERQDAIDAMANTVVNGESIGTWIAEDTMNDVPSAKFTLYGYNIEHLALIAGILQKENLSPDRTVDLLTDIGAIVAIVVDDFEEQLRKAVKECIS